MSSGRHKGLSLFKPSSRKGEFYETQRKETFDVMLKHRAADSDLKALEKKNKINNCERHYSEDSIVFTNTGKRTVNLCAFPIVNLPPKSHDIPKIGWKPAKERIPITLMDIHIKCYNKFDEICKAVGKLKSDDWISLQKENSISIRQNSPPALLQNRKY